MAIVAGVLVAPIGGEALAKTCSRSQGGKGRIQIHAGDLNPALLPVSAARFKSLMQDSNDEIDLNPALLPVSAARFKSLMHDSNDEIDLNPALLPVSAAGFKFSAKS